MKRTIKNLLTAAIFITFAAFTGCQNGTSDSSTDYEAGIENNSSSKEKTVLEKYYPKAIKTYSGTDEHTGTSVTLELKKDETYVLTVNDRSEYGKIQLMIEPAMYVDKKKNLLYLGFEFIPESTPVVKTQASKLYAYDEKAEIWFKDKDLNLYVVDLE